MRADAEECTKPANPVWRLAESLTSLQGRGNTQGNFINLFDSGSSMGRPNGLAMKRTVTRKYPSREQGSEAKFVRWSLPIRSWTTSCIFTVLPSGNRHGVRPLSFKRIHP